MGSLFPDVRFAAVVMLKKLKLVPQNIQEALQGRMEVQSLTDRHGNNTRDKRGIGNRILRTKTIRILTLARKA